MHTYQIWCGGAKVIAAKKSFSIIMELLFCFVFALHKPVKELRAAELKWKKREKVLLKYEKINPQWCNIIQISGCNVVVEHKYTFVCR